MDLEKYKKNPKTQYLAKNLERLLKEEADILMLGKEEGMKELAEKDLENIEIQKKELVLQMDEILEEEISKMKEEDEFPNEIVLEVRAGVGGEEAALFAEELANMYRKYADTRSWSVTVLDESESPLGGYKEASFEIRGKDVYKDLRYETGIHRIQRVPKTEKMGRVHTSQNVNKVETAVRLTHKPTGLVVRATAERSQSANKEIALIILSAKIEAMQKEEEDKKYAANRKEQVGVANRSEKIRTYNILQDRITDHRLNKNWHGIENIMKGQIDNIIDAFKQI